MQKAARPTIRKDFDKRIDASLRRGNLIDQKIGQRVGLKRQGIGIVDLVLVQLDIGTDLENGNVSL